MTEQIYQIFDKIFKKILTLSTIAVINLINGLFGTNYPKDSTITYNWTEFQDDELRRILADTILKQFIQAQPLVFGAVRHAQLLYLLLLRFSSHRFWEF